MVISPRAALALYVEVGETESYSFNTLDAVFELWCAVERIAAPYMAYCNR